MFTISIAPGLRRKVDALGTAPVYSIYPPNPALNYRIRRQSYASAHLHIYKREGRRFASTFPKRTTLPTLLHRGKKSSAMPTYGVEDVITVSELYQDRVLTSPKEDDTVTKPSQALNAKVGLIKANITDLKLDAIVNAANSSLLGGGGVDGVIHRAAGPELLDECETLQGCETGEAKVTNAYRLPCKIIIHAVGPIAYRLSAEQRSALLSCCYKRSLELLVERQLKTIAFPCISTGIYGYPPSEAADVAASTVREFLESEAGKDIEMVAFVMFESKDWHAYKDVIPKYFPPTESDRAGPEEEEEEEPPFDSDADDDGNDTYTHSQPNGL